MNFNSIAITGHTSGIGLAVQNLANSSGKSVQGFSRLNGYDISDSKNVDRILVETKDTEIFINNAYHECVQSDIARKWFDLHKNKDHLIINISSIATYFYDFSSIAETDPLYSYAKNKKDLDKAGFLINIVGKQAKAINVNFAVVDTPFPGIPEYIINRTRENGTIIQPLDAATIIFEIIDKFKRSYFQSNCLILNCDSYLLP